MRSGERGVRSENSLGLSFIQTGLTRFFHVNLVNPVKKRARIDLEMGRGNPFIFDLFEIYVPFVALRNKIEMAI